MLLHFILLGTFIAMLGVIWFQEGWKKGLKLVGIWLASAVTLAVTTVLFGIEPKSAVFGILNLLFWGIWVVGLVIYNIKEGHIGKF